MLYYLCINIILTNHVQDLGFPATLKVHSYIGSSRKQN